MTTQRAEGIDALNAAIAGMAAGASRHLSCFVPALDAALWSSPAFIDTLRGFATADSRRAARVLLVETEGLLRDHPALVTLAQRLPSLILLRQTNADFAPPATQGFMVDDRGRLLLFDSGAPLAATFSDGGQHARPLAGRFDEAWERARPMAELRALGI
ncbi:hypothetical protein EBB59_01070 [Lysobacter pythonis]|uniref:DUF7931 domain-containing protein n=1 Tax=Solilutibacter pythonis TaxID=2483112 RepID=A0A3M2HYU6_9GAMM|nr:hypothetical protein [Lysobacter pythonis]RMH94911.1 hypothetical protein EBB59_01070 [Lysobacter pythonis]